MVLRRLVLLRQRVGAAGCPHELLQQLLWAAAPLQQLLSAVPTASAPEHRCRSSLWRRLGTAAPAAAAREPGAASQQQHQVEHHQEQTEQTEQQQQQPQQPQQAPAAASFEALGVPPQLVGRLAAMGITAPTPVQARAMPAVLTGRNVVIQNPTGSGKTLAYLLPLITRLAGWQWRRPWKADHPHVLVVAPTQELCMQVMRVAREVIGEPRWAAAPCMGGVSAMRQWESLRINRPALVVATPGRLFKVLSKRELLPPRAVRPAAVSVDDLQQRQQLWVEQQHRRQGLSEQEQDEQEEREKKQPQSLTIVLEEAERLLAMEDMRSLLTLLSPLAPRGSQHAPPPLHGHRHHSVGAHLEAMLREYQVLLVSASIKPSTLALASSWAATDPITIASMKAQGAGPGRPDPPPKLQLLPDTISHQVLLYNERFRPWTTAARALSALLAAGNKVLVFVGKGTGPVAAAVALRDAMPADDWKMEVLHGKMAGTQRRAALDNFREGRSDVLLTTDAFGLGLDYGGGVDVVMAIGALAHSRDAYVARAGRTGRAGRRGTVLAVIPDARLAAHTHQIKKVVRPETLREMVLTQRRGDNAWVLQDKPVLLLDIHRHGRR